MSACNLRLLQREEKIESRDEKELCRCVNLLVRWYTAHTLTLKLRGDLNALLHTNPDANTGVFAFSHVAHMHSPIHIHYDASFHSHIHMVAAG